MFHREHCVLINARYFGAVLKKKKNIHKLDIQKGVTSNKKKARNNSVLSAHAYRKRKTKIERQKHASS